MALEEARSEAPRKAEKLNRLLQELSGAVVAFSGGVDSTFLLYKAKQAWGPERLLAVTAASELQPAEEIEEARKTAGLLAVNHLVISTEILSREDFARNSPQRCYYCKRELFGHLLELAGQHRLPAVLEGSNFDDLSDYRPGLTAAREHGIKSPLLEAGLTKLEIRWLSRACGLPTWDRNASPCLATRFPYGERLDPEKLQLVARAERFLKQLGFNRELRVRCHGAAARIEVPPEDRSKVLAQGQTIAEFLKRLGFQYVALDLEGFQSGSMNRARRGLLETEQGGLADEYRT